MNKRASQWLWLSQIDHIEWIGFNQINYLNLTFNQINHYDLMRTSGTHDLWSL